MNALLKYKDLVGRQIVSNRPQLKRLQELYGFPLGRMLSPNCRTWTKSRNPRLVRDAPRYRAGANARCCSAQARDKAGRWK